ncbi:MAG: F0F1 ATP synthase subunit delta [Proteobacteria bacterium]|nr:F0F1 ATP synthase subunit delta [Pseudomonadota bacterium]
MEMDWFTFIAQIVNFLILVVLLRAFLYRPVLRVMDKRQETIAGQLQEARETRSRAEEERESLLRERDELEKGKKEILDEARKDAEEKKKEMIQRERDHVAELREKWGENLDREKEDFLRELGRRVGEQVFSVSRSVLKEFTGSDLEEQVFRRFLQKIEELDGEEKERIRSSLAEDRSVQVVSAKELTGPQREELQAALGRILGEDVPVRFEIDESLIAGVEARLGGRSLSWSMGSYLEAAKDEFSRVIRPDGKEGEEAGPTAPSNDTSGEIHG